MKNKLFITLLFFFLAGVVLSQDVVVLNNGRKISCKIISVDSAKITYTLPHQKRQFSINRSEVYRYNQRSAKVVTAHATMTRKEFSELLTFNFYGGSARPLKDFASQDVNSESSGLAKPGGFVHFAAILKLTDYIGLNLGFRFQSHRFSDELITEQFNKAYRGMPYFTSTSTKWKIKGFFGGVHLTIPIKKIPHLSLDFDVLGGLPKVELPEYNLLANYGVATVNVVQHVSVASAAAFLGGLGLKYCVHKNVAFNLNFSYLQTKVHFTNIFTQSTNGAYSYDDYDQKISTFNVQFGISFLIFAGPTAAEKRK